jgi:S-adenosylmethionine:tRNA ribosyltransferase-isomerase
MQVSLFEFELPQENIATEPMNPREDAKLLHIFPSELKDLHIRNLPDLFGKDDLLVFNDTKVIPAKINGFRGEAKISINLLKQISLNEWAVLAKPAKRLKIGDIFTIANDFYATVKEKHENGQIILGFNVSGTEFYSKLEENGQMPLPPYIKRDQEGRDSDKHNYQTVYAKNKGAVAAPTAGLHFTEKLMQQIQDMGINFAFTTLHVGAGTFLPVKVDDTEDHQMHSEFCILNEETAELINKTKANGNKIIAVGTTSLRVLESATDEQGIIHPFHQETNIFITPGYKFRMVDKLMTNFHLPSSTLFMLVSAFSGLENMQAAYNHAIENKYRFYSYGDSCLLEPNY